MSFARFGQFFVLAGASCSSTELSDPDLPESRGQGHTLGLLPAPSGEEKLTPTTKEPLRRRQTHAEDPPSFCRMTCASSEISRPSNVSAHFHA